MFDSVVCQKSEISCGKVLTRCVTEKVVRISQAQKISRQSRVESVLCILIVGLGISITDHRYATPDVVFDEQVHLGSVNKSNFAPVI